MKSVATTLVAYFDVLFAFRQFRHHATKLNKKSFITSTITATTTTTTNEKIFVLSSPYDKKRKNRFLKLL